ARSGDTMTIVRAQEGTVSRLWSANDIAANMMTAGTLDLLSQKALSLQIANNLSDLASPQTALTNLGVPSSSLVPIGVPLPYPLATPPAGFLKCNGSSFSTAAYPKLALVYPSGILPDLRGEFLRGWDDGRGVDGGRGLLTVESDEIRSHRHIKLNIDNFGVAYAMAAGNYSGQQTGGVYGHPTIGYDSGYAGIGTGATGGSETRPRNIAFNYIVRAI
uniref:phage tail protein n=1 Tax=Yersinia intermedia TaxID=631 RepID=UPI0021BD0501